jgi:hypothetical protein
MRAGYTTAMGSKDKEKGVKYSKSMSMFIRLFTVPLKVWKIDIWKLP